VGGLSLDAERAVEWFKVSGHSSYFIEAEYLYLY